MKKVDGKHVKEFDWELIPWEDSPFYIVANPERQIVEVSNNTDPWETIEFESREELKAFIDALQAAYDGFPTFKAD